MKYEELLHKLNKIGISLSKERNYEVLLEKILTEARSFTRAEGGSLYIREGQELLFLVSQNDKFPENKGLRGLRLPLSRDSIAGYVGLTGELVNLEDVYNLPSEAPYKINLSFDKENNYHTRSMLLVPLQESGDQTIGVLALINAKDAEGNVVPFDPRFESLVHSLASQAAIALRNAQLHNELKDAYLDTIFRLSRAAECRDMDTANHLERISLYSTILAEEMGMDQKFVENIRYASPMHDVGKIGVSDNILLKPGKLTDDEYNEMKNHTVYGAKILSDGRSEIIKISEEIALSHHEKFNGRGYPNGIAGEEIPLSGRIVALADVFDALASKRCYKDAWSIEEVVEYIKKESGEHFDPNIVEAFDRCLDRILEVRETYSIHGK